MSCPICSHTSGVVLHMCLTSQQMMQASKLVNILLQTLFQVSANFQVLLDVAKLSRHWCMYIQFTISTRFSEVLHSYVAWMLLAVRQDIIQMRQLRRCTKLWLLFCSHPRCRHYSCDFSASCPTTEVAQPQKVPAKAVPATPAKSCGKTGPQLAILVGKFKIPLTSR